MIFYICNPHNAGISMKWQSIIEYVPSCWILLPEQKYSRVRRTDSWRSSGTLHHYSDSSLQKCISIHHFSDDHKNDLWCWSWCCEQEYCWEWSWWKIISITWWYEDVDGGAPCAALLVFTHMSVPGYYWTLMLGASVVHRYLISAVADTRPG